MNVDGKHYRTIWVKESEPNVVQIIDQRYLPYKFIIEDLTTVHAYPVSTGSSDSAGFVCAYTPS